jgi:glycosyltransferase involved in cell wall biosynthesis
LKLLVVSHPCVEPLNQEFFARVEAKGWEVSIITPARWRGEYGQRAAARWHHFRGRLLPAPVMLSGNVPLHLYRARLARIIHVERPDAIYVHHEPYGAATAQAFLASRRLRHISIGFFSCQNLAKRYPWPFSSFERYVYARASFAFPVSRAVAEVLRRKGYEGPLDIIPFGIDTRHYAANGMALNRRRPDHGLTVGYVGRLSATKGIDTLLDAVRLLKTRGVRARIIGDGPAAAALKLRASELGIGEAITWTGYVPHEQTPGQYQAMDVLVVPSRTGPRWKEQFGRVVIEALAGGTPVVTSDSGELPELVHATGGGWTFPEGNATALAGRLAALHDDPAARLERGERGRTAVVERFDLDPLATRFMQAIERAMERAA